jgi:hypothetical protein
MSKKTASKKSQAAAFLGRLGGMAGTGESKSRSEQNRRRWAAWRKKNGKKESNQLVCSPNK